MDVGASSTFTIEPADSDLLDQPPRNPTLPFFDRQLMTLIALGAVSLLTAVLAAFGYGVLWLHDITKLQSLCFATWLVAHVLLALNMRTYTQPIVIKGLWSNPIMVVWVLAVLLAITIITTSSNTATALGYTPLTGQDWVFILIDCVVCTCWAEVVKLVIHFGDGGAVRESALSGTQSGSQETAPLLA